MKRKHITFIWISLLACILFAAQAEGVNLSLVPSKSTVAQGESITLDILIDEAAGVAGCTFTVHYPGNVLSLAESPVTTAFFDIAGTDSASIYTWSQNSQTTGMVKLSGAIINSDPDTGGGGKFNGNQTLFTLYFQVEEDAALDSYSFELTETQLCNGPGGWGTDSNSNGKCDETDVYETPPIIVQAYSKDSNQWGGSDLNDDFASLLDDFTQNPTASIQITKSTSVTTTTTTTTTTTLPEGIGYLNGTMRDGSTSIPLGGVTIDVDGVGTYTSSQDGTYQVELPVGSYDVTFMAEGYCKTSISVEINTGNSDLPDIEMDPQPCVVPGGISSLSIRTRRTPARRRFWRKYWII